MFNPNVNRQPLDLPVWMGFSFQSPSTRPVSRTKKTEKERLFKRINRRQAW